jgi:hypothetical protein
MTCCHASPNPECKRREIKCPDEDQVEREEREEE